MDDSYEEKKLPMKYEPDNLKQVLVVVYIYISIYCLMQK